MKGIYVCQDNTDLSVLEKGANTMKLNRFQIVALLIVAVIGFVGVVKINDNSKVTREVSGELLVDIPQISPQYFDYSTLSLSKAKQNGKTVLFFAATSWCNTCSALDLELKEKSSQLPS